MTVQFLLINYFICIQLDALQQKAIECEQLYEKLTTLELKINTESEEKSQYEVLSKTSV